MKSKYYYKIFECCLTTTSLRTKNENNIKYKRVSGVRLEAAGRLTKRFSASRSQRRTKYKGNLENAYSSIKGYSTPVLRGNFKANLQRTVINSTSRVGAFGVKG